MPANSQSTTGPFHQQQEPSFPPATGQTGNTPTATKATLMVPAPTGFLRTLQWGGGVNENTSCSVRCLILDHTPTHTWLLLAPSPPPCVPSRSHTTYPLAREGAPLCNQCTVHVGPQCLALRLGRPFSTRRGGGGADPPHGEQEVCRALRGERRKKKECHHNSNTHHTINRGSGGRWHSTCMVAEPASSTEDAGRENRTCSMVGW
jgi:hypothetical protein